MQLHILVVEDSDELRESLVALLEIDGFRVTSSDNADEAFALVRRERPNLVLTDLMLGATSGLDLITRIRSDLAPPIPPIVVTSGFTGLEKEALQRGAAAFIPKPFHPSTVEKTVAAILAQQDVAEAERAEAAARSRSLRAEAIAAAGAAAARLMSRRGDLLLRADWTTAFLPRYFGFGDAYVTLIRGSELVVATSSNDRSWERGQVIDLPLCRDIMATNSALVVPDLLAIGCVVHGPGGMLLRFFAGVPLLTDSVTVGALCFVDTDEGSIGADGYSILEAFGHRASAALSIRESALAAMWAPSGLLTREGLAVILTAELSRMDREPVSLSLFMLAGSAPWVQPRERTAIADLGERRFAVLLARGSSTEARQATLEIVRTLSRAEGFAGGALVHIEDPVASTFEAQAILRAAEGLLGGVLRSAPGSIERLLIRREERLSAGAQAI